ncbi:MAG: hypothetical protein DMD99_09935 [Candidatus Rokuibacteriota bacterium]|nr:MAG: hypothetical protein DMD99_09935 [Candidatus Rokubacteria bacterium]
MQSDDHGKALGSFDALVHLIVPPPWADHAPRGKDHLVPAGLDVRRGQLAAIVEFDPFVEREGVREVIARDLPGLGHIPDDLGVVVGVDDEQVIVDGAHRLGHREGLFLVSVQTGRVGGQGHPQDPAATRLFLTQGQGHGPEATHEHHDTQENRAYLEMTHSGLSFLTGSAGTWVSFPALAVREERSDTSKHLIASDTSSDQPSMRGGTRAPK